MISCETVGKMVDENIRRLKLLNVSQKKSILFFSKSASADGRYTYLEALKKNLKDTEIIAVIPEKAISELGDKNLLFFSEPKELEKTFFLRDEYEVSTDVIDWYKNQDFIDEYKNIQRSTGVKKEGAILLTYFAAQFLEKMIKIVNPEAVILWNQFYGINRIIAKLCVRYEVPVIYMEFGVLPGTYALDFAGQMGESYPTIKSEEIYKMSISEDEISQAKAMRDYFFETGVNRRKQPCTNELKLIKCKLEKGYPIIVYAGQNDLDSGIYPYNNITQKYHSPLFKTSDEAAIRLFEMAKKNNWNFIYKPHPAMKNYRESNMPKGMIIAEQVNINEVVDMADLIITILSQTAYVASIRKKPVLMLGYNQICNSGSVYEATSDDAIEMQIRRAIKNGFTEKMESCFLRHIAQLKKYYLYDDLSLKPFVCGKNIDKAAMFVTGCARHFLSNNWINWKDELEIAIWGTGLRAESFMTKWYETPQIKIFIDNDKNKQECYFWGKKVVVPKKIIEEKKKVVICCEEWEELAEQLDSMGYIAFEDYIPDWVLDIGNTLSYENFKVLESRISFLKKKKKIVSFMGNCQISRIIESILQNKEFCRDYVILKLPLIQNVSAWQGAVGPNKKIFSQIDCFITQIISDDNKFSKLWSTNSIKNMLNSECKVVKIPNLFFTGYQPQQGHNSEYAEKLTNCINKLYYTNCIFPWGDKFIDELYSSGMSPEKIIERLRDEEYLEEDFVTSWAENSLRELEKREELCDIKISDYIRNNYKKELLFYSKNHPTRKIINELVKRIYIYIGGGYKIGTFVPLKNRYDKNSMLVYPTVRKYLRLEFNERFVYVGKPYYEEPLTFEEYVLAYIKKLLVKLDELESDLKDEYY